MSDRLRVMQRQPRRISITLSYHVHEALLNRSEVEGRSVSNLCAFLLEEALLGIAQPRAELHPLAHTLDGHQRHYQPLRQQPLPRSAQRPTQP
jgi:hypothetical protein